MSLDHDESDKKYDYNLVFYDLIYLQRQLMSTVIPELSLRVIFIHFYLMRTFGI